MTEPSAKDQIHAREKLATDHWVFFETHVIQMISDWARDHLESDIARTIVANLRIYRRFKMSESSFALAQDFGLLARAEIANLMAALELAQYARLALDDVVDAHKTRWNIPSLWVQHGESVAVLVSSILWDGALYFLDAAIDSADASGRRANRALSHFGQARVRIDEAMLAELQFAGNRMPLGRVDQGSWSCCQ